MSAESRSVPRIDVRLMRVLEIVVRERSVSRTASILGQSQPAVSFALRQLREILHDPLLVRSGATLVPTERGLTLAARAHLLLEEIDHLADDEEPEDPHTLTRHVRIVSDNCLGTSLLPRLAASLRHEAPNITVEFCGIAAEDDIVTKLENGDFDLVVANWPSPRDTLRYMPLVEQDTLVVARRSHPCITQGPLTMERYLSLDHLSPTPTATAPVSPIDGRLARLGVARNIALTVPDFGIVPGILQTTDLVFTTCRAFATHLEGHQLATAPAPPEFGPMQFYLLWHDRTHRTAFSRWLRGLVKRSVAEIASEFEPA